MPKIVKKEDILPKDVDGNLHGYCEKYDYFGITTWRGSMVHNSKYGYHEFYESETGEIIKDKTGWYFENIKVEVDNPEKTDILPLDGEGCWHGYCEQYWNTGELFCRGVFFFGKTIGLYEQFNEDGSVNEEQTGWYFMSGHLKIKDKDMLDNNPVPSRQEILLKATYDILKKCNEGGYVKDVLEETVFYDDTDYDGYCLCNDIASELGLPELGEF
jgi:hypothetical protein